MNKKIARTIVFTAALALPLLAAAQAPPTEITQCTLRHDFTGAAWSAYGFACPGPNAVCLLDAPAYTCAACCLLDTIYTVVDWFFVALMIIVVIFVLLGAYNIMTAAGDSGKVQTGRNYILYAVIGAVLAAMARLLPVAARNLLRLS